MTSHPELFVNGGEADIKAEPGAWVRAAGHILAHGRDPYFPPWPDVVQLDAFSPALRAATAATLTDIAAQCDGIRCDMAMLMTNQVFARTWGGRTGPEAERGVLAGRHAEPAQPDPQTVLVAEAYWDMEWTLQQQGFDFCYDKRLYDRIVGGDVSGVRGHLRAGLDYQSRLVRFLENHDEPRLADTLPGEAGRAAAVAIATLPGATLWHEGQFEGRRVRPPVFLSRRPGEPPDVGLAGWYRRLLAAVASHRVRAGAWQLLEVGGWPDNDSCRNLLAWSWSAADVTHGAGIWWWSICPLSPPRGGSGSAGLIYAAAAGLLPTCSMTVHSSGAATSLLTKGYSSPCHRGAATCSPCADPVPARSPGPRITRSG